ncbi:MAG: hypothetical protein R2857_13935 [Vampirovibrionales bacterium]
MTLWQQALGDPRVTVNQLAQALNQLGPAELAQLNHWGWLMLAMAAVILVTNALSLFWPQFLVLYNLNPLKTLWHSARFSLNTGPGRWVSVSSTVWPYHHPRSEQLVRPDQYPGRAAADVLHHPNERAGLPRCTALGGDGNRLPFSPTGT